MFPSSETTSKGEHHVKNNKNYTVARCHLTIVVEHDADKR